MTNSEPTHLSSWSEEFGLSGVDLHSSPDLGDSPEVVVGDEVDAHPFDVHVVETSSLEQVKKWIGNSDEDVAEKGITPVVPWAANDVPQQTDDLEDLAAAARHYVYGNSADARHLQPAIEQAFGPFEMHVLTADVIKIPPGQTLTFTGDKPKVVIASELIFEGTGSNINSQVHLTMRVANVVVNQ